MTRGLFSIENYFAARAHIKVVHYLTIVQCVVRCLGPLDWVHGSSLACMLLKFGHAIGMKPLRILAVTHILACLLSLGSHCGCVGAYSKHLQAISAGIQSRWLWPRFWVGNYGLELGLVNWIERP